MLLSQQIARVVTAFMAFLVCGSFWALVPPLLVGYHMCWRSSISDMLHSTLQGSWAIDKFTGLPGLSGLGPLGRLSMVRILLSCGADVNSEQRSNPYPTPPELSALVNLMKSQNTVRSRQVVVTPLMRAVANKRVDEMLVHWMIDRGKYCYCLYPNRVVPI
jgi:hypothetical protein